MLAMPLTFDELPRAAVAAVAERCGRLEELGVTRLSAYKSSDGTVHVTFSYSPDRFLDSDTFNGREVERIKLCELLTTHLEQLLPADGQPVVIHVC